MAKFKIGNIVELKSSSPLMTVNHIVDFPNEETLYDCAWFSGSKHNTARFSEDALEIHVEAETDG